MRTFGNMIKCAFCFALLAFLCCQYAAASSFQFTKIIDTSAIFPGQGVNFDNFSWAAPNGAGSVAFMGRILIEHSYWDLVYLYTDGGFRVVADESTIMPGSSVPFTQVLFNGALAFDGDKLAFGGWNNFIDVNGRRGIYEYSLSSETLSKVVDSTDMIPGIPGQNFFSIQAGQPEGPRLSNGHLAFSDRSWDYGNGAYAVVGEEIQVSANRSTPMPGTSGNFHTAVAMGIDRDGTVLLWGIDPLPHTDRGLFTQNGDTISRIVGTDTIIPGGSETFEGMGSSHIDEGIISFIGYGQIGQTIEHEGYLFYDIHSGIYTFSEGTLEKLIDVNDPLPGLSGEFMKITAFDAPAFHEMSFHNGNIVFEAFIDRDGDPYNESFEAAIFTNLGGSMTKLLAPGDMIDGKTVRDIGMGGDALRGDEIALTVSFTDGMSAVYLVTAETAPVPEPGSFILLGIGLLGMLAWARMHRI
ncbi:MAG: PEP-CTERM sorting domain-containing protein [Acidobacteria bacterium]|nr:PEP-CTERM sorting domain-containing protein [Acidobacteriota bacterium]